MKILFRGVAGNWPVFTANAKIVPVVANGQVYIAGSQVLQVFGVTNRNRR